MERKEWISEAIRRRSLMMLDGLGVWVREEDWRWADVLSALRTLQCPLNRRDRMRRSLHRWLFPEYHRGLMRAQNALSNCSSEWMWAEVEKILRRMLEEEE